jgi:hypothetical protein
MSSYLAINTETFGFVTRERVNGKLLTNKCGRDFLYYALNYYVPEKHNPAKGNPAHITEQKIFGMRVPSLLAWTSLQFKNAPAYLRSLGLELSINGKPIKGYLDFVAALLTPNASFETAIEQIERAVDAGVATGIDVPLAMVGLLDHVMFVYGYDDESLYVFDTHRSVRVPYDKITADTDNRFIMKLPKMAIQNMWGKMGRVWIVKKL